MIKKEKIREYLPHIIGLLFFVILPLFIFDKTEEQIKIWTYRYYYHFIFLLVAFYANYLIFAPRYFITKKIKFFFSLLLLSGALLTTSQFVSWKYGLFQPPDQKISQEQKPSQDQSAMREKKDSYFMGLHPRLLDEVLLLLLVYGFSIGMRILQQSRKEEEEQKELDKANVETELAFLKNQISPHFFFNSLNNIYALVEINGEKAQKAIEELSSLMRYLIYESNVELIPLIKEFNFIRNYLALMQQRLSAKVNLSVDIQEDIPVIEVPPLLFISFIENAFKHGISYRDKSFINIKLQVFDERIIFSCKNSIPNSKQQKIGKAGGVGISNIKKRLELLYGAKAVLDINESDEIFEVNLEVPVEVKI